MKTERRESLENINVTAEPMVPWRRPPSEREASNTRTVWKHRGSGDGMSAKEQDVNTGNPIRREERSQPDVREEQAGLSRVAERSVVAVKRVMIVERRDLGSRAALEVTRGKRLAPRPSNLVKPRQLQTTFNGLSEGEAWLRCVQERRDPCPKAGCGKPARPV